MKRFPFAFSLIFLGEINEREKVYKDNGDLKIMIHFESFYHSSFDPVK
jgi:hypothetical protein